MVEQDICELPRDLLQKVFDTAVNSMDDEEVVALRECAVVLGVDPMVATPINFVCKCTGEHLYWTEKDFPPYASAQALD